MQITLRLFAALRERAGRSEEPLTLASGATAKIAYKTRFPGLDLPVGYARNGELCSGETALSDGDELALLPPLGGG